MRKNIFISAAFLMLAGLAWASNQPWKTKPYQQWDKGDLELILYNSPWAEKVVVDVNWKRSSHAELPATPTSDAELYNRMTNQKGGMPDTSPPDRSMDSTASSSANLPQTLFYLRWYSSRVMREALAREAVLAGRISDAEAAKLLATPITDYEIIVFGPDMTPFQKLTEDQLKSASSLEGKQSKQKVAPVSVRANKGPDGRTNSLVFLFPKQTAIGADVASTQEKGLEFVCKLKGLEIHNNFDVRKMVDEKGADF